MPVLWAYGVTTVPERVYRILSQTTNSLTRAGFSHPRLFVDGLSTRLVRSLKARHTALEITSHYPKVGAFASWTLALHELRLREPLADYYVIFQDDILVCRNLRNYLENLTPPDFPEKKWYGNLYTVPSNYELLGTDSFPPRTHVGWYPSDQFGRGALALLFDNQAAETLVTSHLFAQWARCPGRGHKAIDAAVIDSLRREGYREYVHNPSLVQHVGSVTTMASPTRPPSTSFPGEQFDALSLR